MKNNQKGFAAFATIIIFALVVGGSFYFYNKNSIIKNVSNSELEAPTTVDSSEAIATSTIVSSATTTAIKTNASVAASVDLWSVFDKMLLAFKNKDLALYNESSYETFDSSSAQFFAQIAESGYESFSQIKKTDFTIKSQDNKQAVYSRPVQVSAGKYTIEQFMFVKISNNWKLLAYSHRQYLGSPSQDSDNDGLTDNEETCKANRDPSCVVSDPNKKDTNGNGWWDSIEKSMTTVF